MIFLVPQGIGDCAWALIKVQEVARQLGAERIDIRIACVDSNNEAEARALEFVRRFDFVSSGEMYPVPMEDGRRGPCLLPGPATDDNGLYRYMPDGPTDLPGIDYVLMPNAPLERAIRLEDWLPSYSPNWDIMDRFRFRPEELSHTETFAQACGPYVTFFLGSSTSNTTAGHNWGAVWTPNDWVRLGRSLQERYGVSVCVVGAVYDLDYFLSYIQSLLTTSDRWYNQIGCLGIGETLSLVRRSKGIISYQSGIGIVGHYMGVPSGVFWRRKGESVSPHDYVSFEEGMASAWAAPGATEQGRHLPLIYGRDGVEEVLAKIDSGRWF
jgi:hypothetical protein